MVNPEKYIKLAEMINTKEDFETIEAFMYNNGKIVLDKRHLYENYPQDCIKKIIDVHNKPVIKKDVLKIGE